jgi:hypothetical protein
MREKSELLERAVEGKWLLCFEHDAHMVACRIQKDGKRFGAGEPIDL